MDRTRVMRTFQRVVPERIRHLVPSQLRNTGWDLVAGPTTAGVDDQWARIVMNRDVDTLIRALPPERCDALEVSGQIRTGYPWRSYEELSYPELDLCADDVPDKQFDFVICEQVLEHVIDPVKAVRNLGKLCRPDGRLLISTPFLIKIHPAPTDYWRFTPDGLDVLLRAGGLEVEHMRWWGNAECAKANFKVWRGYRPWHSLKNDPDLPVSIWAIARHPS